MSYCHNVYKFWIIFLLAIHSFTHSNFWDVSLIFKQVIGHQFETFGTSSNQCIMAFQKYCTNFLWSEPACVGMVQICHLIIELPSPSIAFKQRQDVVSRLEQWKKNLLSCCDMGKRWFQAACRHSWICQTIGSSLPE